MGGSIKEALGDEYYQKFLQRKAWLIKKWRQVGDSEESRMIFKILRQGRIIDASVISNDLEYFKAHYKEHYGNNYRQPLMIASLSGSAEIAEFLLAELGLNYDSPTLEFILSYASAADNEDWVNKIVQVMAKAKKEVPLRVHYICTDSEIKRIIINGLGDNPPSEATRNIASRLGLKI